jgi:hypothetical protein
VTTIIEFTINTIACATNFIEIMSKRIALLINVTKPKLRIKLVDIASKSMYTDFYTWVEIQQTIQKHT